MTTKFEPNFDIAPLQQVVPGTLVIFEQQPAFTMLNRNTQAQKVPVTLAVFDAATSRFVYRYFDGHDPKVLVPEGELVIKPDLFSRREDVSIQPPSAKLFLADSTYLVVHIPNVPEEVRILNLANGALVRATVTSADAFTSWRAGIVSHGEFLPLLTVG